MKITYIYHSSFLVELENCVLLFDYYKGTIPPFSPSKHLFVFVSHKHQDHFQFSIFQLANQYPNITFVLSKDMKMNESYMERKKIPVCARNKIHYIGKNCSLELFINHTSETIQIQTLRSTDSGVAFVLLAENYHIYHAGDLNDWIWKEEEEKSNKDMTKCFQTEINKLKGAHFDIAFLPLDPRQEEYFLNGFHYFMTITHTTYAFPMHFWEDFSIIDHLLSLHDSQAYQENIVRIENSGQNWQLF